ncbi:MAG: cytochrome c biogenesis protein ResB, partial [Rhodoglobus sp.]|nr:cytochrome c biogenesis protein ResB [Rhodoglobus sp.]
TSLGVIKIPDGLAEQIGMIGFLYPTTIPLESGALSSSHPELRDPTVTLEVYSGDLGLDEGKAVNAYNLDITGLEQIAGRKSETPGLKLTIGDVAELPHGLGTIELTAIPRFVSLDIHHDPAQVWVLLFALTSLAGLLTSLFVPRRRVWVKAVTAKGGAVRLEYAGLARGEDPGLESAIADIARRHAERLSPRLEA